MLPVLNFFGVVSDLLDNIEANILRPLVKQLLSDRALQRGWLHQESLKARRQFWLMPQLHAECLIRVERVIPLMEEWVDEATAEVARRNREWLLSHGRYPWRDAALGREVETNA